MIYTGPVDAYFDYCYGKLPYRSLEFKHETHDVTSFPIGARGELSQRAALHARDGVQISNWAGTRQDEHRLRVSQGEGDPYYPVPRKENAELYARYKTLADTTPDVHFVGRLATYKYYNMDQIVAQALTAYGKIASMKRDDAMMVYSHGNGNGKGNGNGVTDRLVIPERVITAVNG